MCQVQMRRINYCRRGQLASAAQYCHRWRKAESTEATNIPKSSTTSPARPLLSTGHCTEEQLDQTNRPVVATTTPGKIKKTNWQQTGWLRRVNYIQGMSSTTIQNYKHWLRLTKFVVKYYNLQSYKKGLPENAQLDVGVNWIHTSETNKRN